MHFWVYENFPNNKARVHRANCRNRNSGSGLRNIGKVDTGRWHGPYLDVREAKAKAHHTGRADVRDCKVCTP